jgi:hypothetical protein
VARAIDAGGNGQDSAGIRVRVDNHGAQFVTLTAGTELQLPARGAPRDAGAPWAAMIRPIAGVVGGAAVVLEAFAVDDADGVGVASVQFLVDGAAVGAGAANGSHYTLNWNSAAVVDGQHTLAVRATDQTGNVSMSESVAVLVDNAPPTLVPLSTYPVMVSPPNLDQGTVRVWVQFNPTGAGMDAGSPPTVEVMLPGGGTRAVGEVLYLAQRGLWTGDVAVNRGADGGAGPARIEVRGARDLGGNAMATVPHAGYIQLVAHNPGLPLAGAPVINNMGVPYQYGPGPTHRVHDGVDYLGAAGTSVAAVRAGTVTAIRGAGTNRTALVQVRVGTDAAGAAVNQFDVYLHLNNPEPVGTPLNVGDSVGHIGANYGAFNHVHVYVGDAVVAAPIPAFLAGYPQPFRNPLFLYDTDANRDPGGNEPTLTEGGADGQTIYLLRRSGAAPAPILTPFAPADRVYGQAVIIGELADHFGYAAPAYPFSIGYRIRPTRALGRAVGTEEAPYLVSRWFEYDVILDDLPDFDRYVTRAYSTTWPSHIAGVNFPWTRNHHALVSNSVGTSGAGADRTADQFWYTRAPRTGVVRDNGSDVAAGANILPEARFRDGRYTIELFGADLTVRSDPAAPSGRRLYTRVGTQGVVVDKEREKRSDRRFALDEGPALEELAPLTKDVTLEMCDRFSGPARNYHNDIEEARKLGFPDIVVQGMMSLCFLSELLTRRFGPGWYLGGRMNVNLVNVLWQKEQVICRGTVREVTPEGARRRAHLQVWCEKPDSTKTVVGTASALEG